LWVITRAHKNRRLLQSEGRFLPLAGLGSAAGDMFSPQLHGPLKHTGKSVSVTWRFMSRNQTRLPSSSDLYLGGGDQFVSRLVRRLPKFFFCCFPQSIQATTGMVPRLGHDRFLPNPFRIIIHQSSYHLTLYSLATNSVVKYTAEVKSSVESEPTFRRNMSPPSSELKSRPSKRQTDAQIKLSEPSSSPSFMRCRLKPSLHFPCYLVGLLFDPEDGGDMFLRKRWSAFTGPHGDTSHMTELFSVVT
jgi:hypothetical protein